VAIIRDDEVKYMKGFGMANMEQSIPYSASSFQNIASVSKTTIGISLMKAVEEGLLKLDDPVNKYLPYKLVNPKFPNQSITIRHLATHTSSLKDPEDYERAYIFQEKIEVGNVKLPKGYKKMIQQYNSNSRVGPDEFAKSIFVPGGKYYAKKNFLKAAPGTKFSYSNIGAGIASRIIEIVSGMSFQEFTAKHIFDPLDMKNTTWDLTSDVLKNKVIPYLMPSLSIPHYDLITFADGGLITSVEDMSKYIIEIMKCYEGKGKLLSKEQCREMIRPYLKDSKSPYGLFWTTTQSGLSIGHNGADPGVVTNVFFQPKTGVAKIVFANMLPYDKLSGKTISQVWATMRKYEELVK